MKKLTNQAEPQTPGMTLAEAARERIANGLQKVERGVCWLQRMVRPFRFRPIDGAKYIQEIIHEDGSERVQWWLKNFTNGGSPIKTAPPFGSGDERSAVWSSRPMVFIHSRKSSNEQRGSNNSKCLPANTTFQESGGISDGGNGSSETSEYSMVCDVEPPNAPSSATARERQPDEGGGVQ